MSESLAQRIADAVCRDAANGGDTDYTAEDDFERIARVAVAACKEWVKKEAEALAIALHPPLHAVLGDDQQCQCVEIPDDEDVQVARAAIAALVERMEG